MKEDIDSVLLKTIYEKTNLRCRAMEILSQHALLNVWLNEDCNTVVLILGLCCHSSESIILTGIVERNS